MDFRAYEAAPGISVVVLPDVPQYTCVAVSNDFLKTFGLQKTAVVGKSYFDLFPAKQGSANCAHMSSLQASFEYVIQQSEPHDVALFCNDADSNDGRCKPRYWKVRNVPLVDDHGIVSHIVHSLTDITEQIDYKQKFQNILHQATDPILILKGWEMVLDEANDALFAIWQVDHSAIGKTFLEILPEMRDQGFLELLQQVYTTGKPFQGIEIPAVFKAAEEPRTVYFNFTYYPYRELDNSISGVLVLATDVTGQVLARKAAEESREKLRQSKERFDLVTRATQDAIWDWNLQTDTVEWNEAVQALFGYSNIDHLQKADWWYNHVHPHDREEAVAQMHSIVNSGGNVWTREYRFLCADGSYKNIYDRGFVSRDEDGNPVRMIGSMQDITERKQQELSLKESRKKWQQLADSIPSFVWSADGDGRINFFNQYWYQFTGLTEEETLGFGWAQVLHPDDAERCLTAWQEAREQGVFYELEARYRSKEGDYLWVIARGVPIKNEEGAIVSWYGTSTDIHVQKMLSENLESMVAERTENLRRSNDSLEQFAYAASHDMKEPIRKIHYFSDRLKERLAPKMDAEDFRMFDRLLHASKRMSTLIDDLLAYSQAAQGDVEMEQIDLNEKVKLVLEDLELEVQEKGAHISIGTLPVIAGNRRQLQQAFQNLISNAIKYNKPGEAPQVRIGATMVKGSAVKPELGAAVRNNEFHLIEVVDNGIGFNQKDAERIFNVFTRLHGNAEYRGTGVGLSIVQKVVENHRGYIWAESAEGKGATFKILLPKV